MSENNEIKEPLNKNNKVPKLRFQGFKNDYNNFRFSTLFKIFNGLNKDKESFGFGNPIINYMDVNKNLFLNKKIILGKVNTTKDEIKRFKITTDDILLTRTSETKKEIAYASCLLDEVPNCVYSGFLLKASPIKKELTYAPYITLLLHSPIYRNKLMKVSTETSRALINSDNLSGLNLLIPSITEQQKIFSLFSSLEIKITNIEAKINILKKYKKGMQKNIFDSSKTKEYLVLKNIIKFENKSKIPANNSIENGNFVLYKSGQKNGTINDYSHEGIYIIANDVGIAQFKLTSGKFAYTDHCICFRCQSDEETIVLCNYLQSLEKKITYVGFTGTGLKNIDRQYLGMIRIPKVDNKKIAKSFNLIDEAIRNYENILEKITIIKKLLLKQMFI